MFEKICIKLYVTVLNYMTRATLILSSSICDGRFIEYIQYNYNFNKFKTIVEKNSFSML